MGAFFLLRINDHMQYLRKISATLDGTGEFQGSSHHDCMLGRWINTTGPQECAEFGPAAVEVFKAIYDPHEAFHLASGRALAFRAAGREHDSARESTELHRLSNELVSKLLHLDSLAAGKP
jgi:hypothetical protein